MKITVPYPPTANLYWRHAQGRTFLSAAAKSFKSEVRKRLTAARVTPQGGPLALHVHVYRPRKVGDLDNTLKVLGDALNGAAWHDDKQVVEIHAYRHDDKENPRAEVEVLPAMLNNALQSWEPTVASAGKGVDFTTLPGGWKKRHRCGKDGCRKLRPCQEHNPLHHHQLDAMAQNLGANPRKGDAAKTREQGLKRVNDEQWDVPLPDGRRLRNKPRTGAKAGRPDYVEAYTPPRSKPVDAAKEAEATFAPAECACTFEQVCAACNRLGP